MESHSSPSWPGDILTEHHDNRMAGHFGMEKTLSRLRQSPYFWPKMRATVEDWCRKCGVCARTKATNRKMKAPMKSVGAGVTMERVGIDILGTVARDSSREPLHPGGRGLLDEMDGGVPDTQSHGVYGGLRPGVSVHVTVWIPQQIHSDQGREFEGALFQEMCNLLQIDKTRTTPWRPCSNGARGEFQSDPGCHATPDDQQAPAGMGRAHRPSHDGLPVHGP